MSKFNAGRFLEANDLQLVGPGSTEGQVRVMTAGGEEKTLNLTKMLAEKGIKADEIIINSAESALNVSPVDLIDRAALSFGNVEGQLKYLKKNYQDSKVVDGDIMVKNKGVWQRMDASGLGDGSGWDMAKEFAKDVLDWTGEAPVIAGQLGGAVAGSAVAPGVGTIAGAGAGAGAGRGASIVMGKILGTYEGDAREITRDIVMDTVLSAAGEGVALGARNSVLPAMRNGFKKISEWADPSVKDGIAGMLRQGAGMSEIGAYTVLKEPDEVFKAVSNAQLKAGQGATADMITREARQEAVNILSLGAENAQNDISRWWRGQTRAAVAEVTDDTVIDVVKPLREVMNDIELNMGLIKAIPIKGAPAGIVKFQPVTAEVVAKELNIGVTEARQISMKMGKFMGSVNALVENASTKPRKGQGAAKEALELLSDLRKISEEVASVNPEAARIMKPITAKMQVGIRNQFPETAQKIMQSADSGYANNIEYVTTAMRAARTEGGIEGLLSQIKNGGTVNIPNMIDSLASRRPGGESWKKALHHRISAIEMVDTTPSGTFGGFTRPVVRGAAKALYPMAKGAAMAGQAVKGLSESARLELLKNPQAWEALSGEVMRGFGQK